MHLTDFATPEILIPDTAPLIHLAAAGKLELLQNIGRVVLVDMVVYEATERQDKPYVREIGDWIQRGTQSGSNAPIHIVKTEIGELYRNTKLVEPNYRVKGAGELAILAWLTEEVENSHANIMVVYENGKVPNLIRRNAMDVNIAVLTTRAFLEYSEQQGHIPSAEILWKEILDKVPSANTAVDVFVRYRPEDQT